MAERLKPLPRAPYTEEDMDIWLSVGMRDQWSNGFRLEELSMNGDRRDAELMLHFKTAYRDIIGPGYLHYGVWHVACAFQGIPVPAGSYRP